MIQQTEQENKIEDDWNSNLLAESVKGLQCLEELPEQLNMNFNESLDGFVEGTSDTLLFSAPNATSVKL